MRFYAHENIIALRSSEITIMRDLVIYRDLWRRSGTKRRQTNRGASRPIVVGRIDVVGVVEVETERAVGPWSGMCQGEVA